MMLLLMSPVEDKEEESEKPYVDGMVAELDKALRSLTLEIKIIDTQKIKKLEILI